MKVTENLEIIKDCVFFRPVGKVTLTEAVELVAKAIKFARSRQIPKLFVNTTGLTGFPSPTLADRYFMVRDWAAIAQKHVRMVMVVPVEMIDPEKFGMTVARNAGMVSDVFATESEALGWLASEAGI